MTLELSSNGVVTPGITPTTVPALAKITFGSFAIDNLVTSVAVFGKKSFISGEISKKISYK